MVSLTTPFLLMNRDGHGRMRPSWSIFKVPSRSSPGMTEEDYERPRYGEPRFEPGISRIRSRSASHSTATFGDNTYRPCNDSLLSTERDKS
jgi:hypothetical protein